MKEALSFGDMDRIDEFIWMITTEGWGTLKEVENEWTVQDMMNAYTVKTRKLWAEEAHAMLMDERSADTK